MDGTDEEERRNTQEWEVFDRQANSSFLLHPLSLTLHKARAQVGPFRSSYGAAAVPGRYGPLTQMWAVSVRTGFALELGCSSPKAAPV